MLVTYYTECEKEHEQSVKVHTGLSSMNVGYIRPLSSEEIGKIFTAIAKWYTTEGWKQAPFDHFIRKETGIKKLYAKLNMQQSQIAGAILQNQWLIETEVNQHDYKPVYLPFSFYDLDQVIVAKLGYLLNASIRPF